MLRSQCTLSVPSAPLKRLHCACCALQALGGDDRHATPIATAAAPLHRAKAALASESDMLAMANMPMLQLRPMPRPAPAEDILAAARYSLERDITAALTAAPASGFARKKLGALRAWLHVLHQVTITPTLTRTLSRAWLHVLCTRRCRRATRPPQLVACMPIACE